MSIYKPPALWLLHCGPLHFPKGEGQVQQVRVHRAACTSAGPCPAQCRLFSAGLCSDDKEKAAVMMTRGHGEPRLGLVVLLAAARPIRLCAPGNGKRKALKIYQSKPIYQRKDTEKKADE
jgi:hypothetical protein